MLPPCGLSYLTASIRLQSPSPYPLSLSTVPFQYCKGQRTPDLAPFLLQSLSNFSRGQMEKLKPDKHLTWRIGGLPPPRSSSRNQSQNSGCGAGGARVERPGTIEFGFDLWSRGGLASELVTCTAGYVREEPPQREPERERGVLGGSPHPPHPAGQEAPNL